MKAISANSVFGVMNMLNTEKSYIQYSRSLWILRAIMMDVLECRYPDNSYGLNDKSADYWLYELTNNLIAASWVKGYDFYIEGHDVKCYARQPRTGSSFITYDEAQYIVNEIMTDNMLSYLYRLKDLVSFAKDRIDDRAFYIYVLVDDLLHAITGETKILN